MSRQCTEKNGFIVHWDGKILPDIANQGKKVETLPIVISHGDFQQLLGVPITSTGTGYDIAKTVNDLLDDYNLLEKVQGMCFDTTAVNTGRFNGASGIFEQLIERDLFLAPCRHHILEITLRDVFEVKMNLHTNSPNVALFDSFKKDWDNIDKSNFDAGIDDEKVKNFINEQMADKIRKFCFERLDYKSLRGDYKELLQLVFIFLVGKINNNTPIYKPGAIHHVRWMAKAIYTIKMYLFRNQIDLRPKQIDSLREICIFLVRLYTPVWFNCVNAISAPRVDLQFVQEAINYETVDKKISERVISKMSNHLWYLADEALALSFFDKSVSNDEKRQMIKALENQSDGAKRVIAKPKEITETF